MFHTFGPKCLKWQECQIGYAMCLDYVLFKALKSRVLQLFLVQKRFPQKSITNESHRERGCDLTSPWQ